VERFEYKVLVSGNRTELGVMWFDSSRRLTSNLTVLLNEYGEEGWQVVGTLNTGDSCDKIILMRCR
jgi:hypothetical protein